MPLPAAPLPPVGRPVNRSRAAATAAAVAAVALAAGGTGYAAAAGKPPKVLSTVCVAKSGAVSVPTKHGCGKGAVLERLASPVPGRTGATGPAGPPGAAGQAGVAGPAGNNGG